MLAPVDDREGIRHPILLTLVDPALMHQIPMEQYQRSLLDLQRQKLVLHLSIFDLPTIRPLGPDWSLHVHECRTPILTPNQSLSKRLSQVRAGSNAETPVLESGVFERVPERKCG